LEFVMQSRIAAAVLAVALLAPPAAAGDFMDHQYLEAMPGASHCRTGMLLSLPASWDTGDGAVVLMTMGEVHDRTRDALLSTLLAEEAAVLELAPPRCEGAPAAQNAIRGAAVEALEAMTLTMGAGMTVLIGHGPGARAILDIAQAPADDPARAQRPRYAAALALGDGPAAFAPVGAGHMSEAGRARLALLCGALSPLVDGRGAAPPHKDALAASHACLQTMAGAALPRPTPSPAVALR
jgi:hypothetical protein